MQKHTFKTIAVLGLAFVALAANAQSSKRVITVEGNTISDSYASAQQLPLKCEGAKPVKLFVAFMITGTEGHKEARGHGNTMMCWDREVDSESEIQRLHGKLENKPSVTKITILSIMRLRA